MSNLRVNIISPFTGSKVTIIGFSATGSLEGTSSYANFSTTASYVDGYTTLPEFNAFTSSYVTDSGSFDSRIGAQESFSSSLDATFVNETEFGSYTSSNDSRVAALETESGSIRTDFNSFTSSYNIDSGSFNTRITNLESFSSSLDTTFVSEVEFGAYTSSANLRLDSLETESGSIRSDFNTFTASYNTGSFTGSFIGDGSGLFGITADTASYVLNAVSASYSMTAVTASYILASGIDGTVANAVSSSYAITASYALNAGASSGSLATLTDTTITAPAAVDVLTYDGVSAWVNSPSKTTVATTLLIANWIIDGDFYYQDITHNLGTEDVDVTLYDATTKETILPDRITRTSTNVVRIHISINTIDVRALVSPRQLVVQGSSGRNVVLNPSSPYTAQNNDIIIWDVSGGSGTVNLPVAATAGNFRIDVKKIDSSANTITVDPNGAELIESGSTAIITTQYEAISTVCDSTQWWIIASF
jgi:hypothetical protein